MENKPSRDAYNSKRARDSRRRDAEKRQRKEERRRSYAQLPAYKGEQNE